VVIGPATITQVTDLQLEVLAELGSAALRPILLNLMLDLPRIQKIKLEVGDAKHVAQLIITINFFNFIRFITGARFSLL